MRTCTKCKVEKPFTEFYKHSLNKSGYQSQCKQCGNERLKEYYRSPEGKAYQKRWFLANKERHYANVTRWHKKNRKKTNQFVYNWYEKNVDTFVKIQDKYQSKVPPSVYCIKYDDEVIYVGKARKPLARVNVHLSTIKTDNNITKVNKLHSYCDFDKSRFKYEFLEQGEYDSLLERERYWEEYYDAKGNYKRIFGKVKSINQILKDIGGKTSHEKYGK